MFRFSSLVPGALVEGAQKLRSEAVSRVRQAQGSDRRPVTKDRISHELRDCPHELRQAD
jgi:hypothetical protein